MRPPHQSEARPRAGRRQRLRRIGLVKSEPAPTCRGRQDRGPALPRRRLQDGRADQGGRYATRLDADGAPARNISDGALRASAPSGSPRRRPPSGRSDPRAVPSQPPTLRFDREDRYAKPSPRVPGDVTRQAVVGLYRGDGFGDLVTGALMHKWDAPTVPGMPECPTPDSPCDSVQGRTGPRPCPRRRARAPTRKGSSSMMEA